MKWIRQYVSLKKVKIDTAEVEIGLHPTLPIMLLYRVFSLDFPCLVNVHIQPKQSLNLIYRFVYMDMNSPFISMTLSTTFKLFYFNRKYLLCKSGLGSTEAALSFLICYLFHSSTFNYDCLTEIRKVFRKVPKIDPYFDNSTPNYIIINDNVKIG